MKLSMRYDPVKLGPDPVVYSIPKRQSSYRVDIYVMRAGATVADRRVLRYPDRFRASDVAENALAEFRAMIPPNASVEDAYFEVWAG